MTATHADLHGRTRRPEPGDAGTHAGSARQNGGPEIVTIEDMGKDFRRVRVRITD